jgi:hypothetical protein
MTVIQVCNSFGVKLQSSCLFYWRSTHQFICVTPQQYTIQVYFTQLTMMLVNLLILPVKHPLTLMIQ